MFGRQDNQQQNQDNPNDNAIDNASIDGAIQADAGEEHHEGLQPAYEMDGSAYNSPGEQNGSPAPGGMPSPQDFSQPAAQATPAPDNDWQHPGLPSDEGFGQPAPISDIMPGQPGATEPLPYRPPKLASSSDDSSNGGGTTGDLADLKQQALAQLNPIVDHLEQSPEEEFHTTMMMIRASDDQSLLPKAYDAANRIADEKIKAQALLDVVNEINYFTHQNGN